MNQFFLLIWSSVRDIFFASRSIDFDALRSDCTNVAKMDFFFAILSSSNGSILTRAQNTTQ